VPLERPFDRLTALSKVEGPPVPNIRGWEAPEDNLSNTLRLLGLRCAPIDMTGASNKL